MCAPCSQNQLLTRGLSEVLDQILLHSGETVSWFQSQSSDGFSDVGRHRVSIVTLESPTGGHQLLVLADMWDRFFTETLPTLQAIFYPVQVRQTRLWSFK